MGQSIMTSDSLFVLGILACGALAGWVARWGPLSGWAALAFPLIVPPLGIGLGMQFC